MEAKKTGEESEFSPEGLYERLPKEYHQETNGRENSNRGISL